MRNTCRLFLGLALWVAALPGAPNESFHGVGEGETLDLARESAMRALVQSIQVHFVVRTEIDSHEDSTGFRQSTSSWQQSFSAFQLKNVQESIEATTGGYRVHKWIDAREVQNYFASIRRQIFDHVSLAGDFQNQDKLGLALHHLYSAFLLARIYPDTLTLHLANLPNSPHFAVTALQHAINDLLSGFSLSVTKSYREEDGVIVELQASHSGRAAQQLLIAFNNGLGREQAPVENGRTRIALFLQSTGPMLPLDIEILFPSTDLLQADPLLLALHQQSSDLPFDRFKHVQIDLSRLQQIDFTAEIHDRFVRLTPNLTLVQPLSFAWDLGDGTRSDLQVVEHWYDEIDRYCVALCLNGNPALTCRKRIDLVTRRIEPCDSISGQPVALPQVNLPAPAHPAEILSLLALDSCALAQQKLQEWVERGLCAVGAERNFHTLIGKYALICSDNKAKAMVWRGERDFIDLKSGQHLPDLGCYRGSRILWIEWINYAVDVRP